MPRRLITPFLPTAVVPNASDLASPESVTSIEFFRPTPDIRGRRPASLGPSSPVEKEKSYERRASSSSRRRDGSKRISNHWSEDKENLHTTTTTITTTTTSSKRGRRHHNGGSNDGVLSEHAAPQLPSIHPEEENDGGTTSGESPDLGIGSDYHFSSLERGTHIMRSVIQTNNDLPPPPLCSEPSKYISILRLTVNIPSLYSCEILLLLYGFSYQMSSIIESRCSWCFSEKNVCNVFKWQYAVFIIYERIFGGFHCIYIV